MLEESRDQQGNKQLRHAFTSWRVPESATIATILFLLSLLVYILLIPKIMHSWNPTGDEPHYLVIIKSLVYDHDLDLRNNYDKGPDIPHVVIPPNGTWRPAHDIGLPLVMYVPFYLGDEFGVYVMLSIIASLIGCSIFLLAFELTHRLSFSILTWLFTAFLPPGFLYAFQLYPEMLGALLLVWSIRFLIRDHLTSPQWILVGIWAGCMPWLVGRFAPLSVFITVAGIYAIYRYERRKRRIAVFHVACLVVPEMVLAAIYIVYLQRYYGSASPMALHPSAGFVTIRPGILGFLRLFMGWLVDQRMGLFIFSPFLVLSIAGMIYIWRIKYLQSRLVILAIIFYYLLIMISYDDFWVQFSVPTRYLIIITPLLTLCSSYAFLYTSSRLFRFISVILVLISLSNTVMVINDQNLAYSVYFNKSPLLTEYSKKAGINLTEFLPFVEDSAAILKFKTAKNNMYLVDTDKPLYFMSGFDVLQGSIIVDTSAMFGRAAYIARDGSVNGHWLTAPSQVNMPPGIIMVQVRVRYSASAGETDPNASAFTIIVTSNETGEEIQRKAFRITELDKTGAYKILDLSILNPKSQVFRFSIDYDAPLPLVLDFVGYKSIVPWWSSWGLVIIWSTIIALFTSLALWRRSK